MNHQPGATVDLAAIVNEELGRGPKALDPCERATFYVNLSDCAGTLLNRVEITIQNVGEERMVFELVEIAKP